MTENTDADRYPCSGYGIGFDACSAFSLSIGERFDKKVLDLIIILLPMLIIESNKGPTDGLDDKAITAEAGNSINFTEQQKSLHYKGNDIFLFVNGLEISTESNRL